MWTLMVLAMMLPSAAPMLSTYLDIAEAATAKGMSVASPLALTSGYIAVWLSFALAAALLQGMVGPLPSRWAGGALLIAAGVYQFTPMKHACLAKCRQPMPYFLSNWTDRPSGVFRSGIRLGLACLGCCWAVMLLAFGGASMNILWMALIGAAAILEKTVTRPRALVWGIGLGLTAAGAAILAGA
jgi:predicted metal-binding membrane protein